MSERASAESASLQQTLLNTLSVVKVTCPFYSSSGNTGCRAHRLRVCLRQPRQVLHVIKTVQLNRNCTVYIELIHFECHLYNFLFK